MLRRDADFVTTLRAILSMHPHSRPVGAETVEELLREEHELPQEIADEAEAPFRPALALSSY